MYIQSTENKNINPFNPMFLLQAFSSTGYDEKI